MKFVWQISYPPANGSSLVSYKCRFSPKMIGLGRTGKMGPTKTALAPKLFWRGVTDRFFDTIYGCVWIFSFSSYSLCLQGDNVQLCSKARIWVTALGTIWLVDFHWWQGEPFKLYSKMFQFSDTLWIQYTCLVFGCSGIL